MGITTKHKSYDAMRPIWARIRHVLSGTDAVKEAGEVYLPKLSEQETSEYEAYNMRAGFFPATARTHDALMGLLFSRPLALEMPPALDEINEDIDLAGSTLADFTGAVAEEVLSTMRCFVVVDHNGDSANPRAGTRPYLRYYPAEAILDWRTRVVNGAKDLAWIKVYEVVEVQGEDEFDTDYIEQYRVFDIFEGQYRQRVFQATDKEMPIQIGEDIIPRVNSETWAFIPGALIGPRLPDTMDKPPLLDLADVNLSHYRTSADLEHGAHFTGLPQPWIAGVSPESNTKFHVGSSEIWAFESPDAKAAYLTFGGDGLSALEKLMDRKEGQMAALGARLLAPEKKAAESGDALAIRRGGELSSLANIAMRVSIGMTKVMRYLAAWAGAPPEDVSLNLNTQFVDERITAQEMTALVGAWQQGAISLESLLFNFQRGGRLPEDRQAADEMELIEADTSRRAAADDDEPPLNEEAGSDAAPPAPNDA